MLKPTHTYRMSTAGKTRLTKISDPHLRGAIKRSMIDADLTAAIQVKKAAPQPGRGQGRAAPAEDNAA